MKLNFFGQEIYYPTNEIEPGWFEKINQTNRRMLLGQLVNMTQHIPGLVAPTSPSWKLALNTLAAELAHQALHDPQDLAALIQYYAYHINPSGEWQTTLDHVESAMKGYSLLYLAQETGELKYESSAHKLADFLINQYPRSSDGSLPYEPHENTILVDSLAMVSPFLARYALMFESSKALDLSIHQLVQFVIHNLDSETRLPYHGYYPSGAKRLGLQAWGRGVGWYLMGLADTLREIPPNHPQYPLLAQSFQDAVDTLVNHQRVDGNWRWAILQKNELEDTSTTALIAYSMFRGMEAGLLDERYQYCIESSLLALQSATLPDGLIDYSLGECLGLGKYPQQFGPTPWGQGAAVALAACALKHQ